MSEAHVLAPDALSAYALTSRIASKRCRVEPDADNSIDVCVPDVAGRQAVGGFLHAVQDWLETYGIDSTRIRLGDRTYTMTRQHESQLRWHPPEDLPDDVELG
jgi:hypothetical protein